MSFQRVWSPASKRVSVSNFCYFCDHLRGGPDSSIQPLYVSIEFRLSLHLSTLSHSVVYGAVASALSSSPLRGQSSKSIRESLTRPITPSLGPEALINSYSFRVKRFHPLQYFFVVCVIILRLQLGE